MKYNSDVNAGDNNHKQTVIKVETGLVTITPQQLSLHNNFRLAARDLQKSIVRTAYYLAVIKHQRIHRKMGYSSIGEYALVIAGFSPRQTKALLFLARKLPEFQAVENAVEEGDLSWTKALEICRSTDPQDQDAWVDIARNMPLTELKDKVRKPNGPPTQAPSEGPTQLFSKPDVPKADLPKNPASEYHHLSLKLTTEQLARWHSSLEFLMKGRSQPKENLLLEGLAALAQSSPSEAAGGPPYLIVMLECPTCHRATIPTNRGEFPAPKALLQAGHCDAMVEDPTGHRRATIPPKARRLALANARYHCQGPGCRTTNFLEIHHRTPHSQGGSHHPENLIVLCWRCHRKLHEAEERARQVKNLAPE